ncbi:MAG: hypothetical protein LUF81_01540, partial [Clostridiales bacterium]|nr:hypothetical protein [Clostridiales bacterium]
LLKIFRGCVQLALAIFDEIWTANRGILLEFFHLGVAVRVIYPFTKTGLSMFMRRIPPTLSPNDPNFPEWWAKHKSEWEGRK